MARLRPRNFISSFDRHLIQATKEDMLRRRIKTEDFLFSLVFLRKMSESFQHWNKASSCPPFRKLNSSTKNYFFVFFLLKIEVRYVVHVNRIDCNFTSSISFIQAC